MHWAHNHFDTLENTINNTGWTLNRPSSDKGPLRLNHNDGSELLLVNSSITGGFSIEYEPANDTVSISEIEHQSVRSLTEAIETAEQILDRHTKKN